MPGHYRLGVMLGYTWSLQAGSTYYTPDDEGKLKLVREAEDGETQESKNTSLCGEENKRVTLSCVCISYL
jgi:hypothetical protein